LTWRYSLEKVVRIKLKVLKLLLHYAFIPHSWPWHSLRHCAWHVRGNERVMIAAVTE